MSSARGDQKPCIRDGCSGTMQFGREPLPPRPAERASEGERGWVCSERPEHFQRAVSTPEPQWHRGAADVHASHR